MNSLRPGVEGRWLTARNWSTLLEDDSCGEYNEILDPALKNGTMKEWNACQCCCSDIVEDERQVNQESDANRRCQEEIRMPVTSHKR